MTTLTERYVDEVARYLPQDRQDDIRDELHGLITETVESRTHQSQDHQVAEHQVLTEMGEPAQLAASYTDRSMTLIGPRLYRSYISLLKVLPGTVVPLFTVGYAVLELTDGRDFTDILASSALVGLNLGAQLFTLVTVVFVILDRTDRTPDAKWSPSQLPKNRPASTKDAKPGRAATAWLGLSIAVQVAVFILIVWQHRAAPYTLDDGSQVPVLEPELFSGWIWPILTGLAAVIILDVLRAAGRTWTIRFAAIYTVAQGLFFLPLAWVFSQQLIFDQRFLDHFNNHGWHTPDEFYTGIALILIIWFCWTTFDQFRTSRQADHR
ncbi:HAAS signaling domain-containing protein [Nesterenkonia ebinurensis]|uniref:HAAS signaling domain-containing protein n=1 Tax=Nesterenkonia ebinurensis TaxID=2608252 RepID=UPI00123E3871|nr:hypothetical protein [Nesterenkonia ebinurensis]